MKEDFVSALQCPICRVPLRLATAEEIAQINEMIDKQQVENHNLQLVTRALEGGLVNANGTHMYPIYDDTPYLMSADAIPLPPDGPAE